MAIPLSPLREARASDTGGEQSVQAGQRRLSPGLPVERRKPPDMHILVIGVGFQAEKSFDEIIRVHIEDELGGTLPA